MIAKHSALPAPPSEAPYGSQFPEFEEESSGGTGFTLVQLWNMVLAHLWLSIGIFAILISAAFLVISKLPRSYDATAALIVNIDNTDPLAGRNSAGQNGSFFPTQVELISNNTMLLPVVETLKLQENPDFTGDFVGDRKALTDIVLANLRNSISVRPGSGSQLLYISAEARNPVMAADIANAVADEYLKQSRERINAPASERAQRYTAQLQELTEKLAVATNRVTEFRQKYGLSDMKDTPTGDSEGTALVDLQGKLLEQQNSLRQLEARVGATGAEGSTSDGAEVIAMRGKLASLESDLVEARTTMGPKHPRVVQLQSEIEATRAALQAGASQALARSRELRNQIQGEFGRERERLLTRRVVQDQGAKLLLELQLAKDNYAAALRGLDQMQFASAGDYKDVTLVSRAEPPIEASRPNKTKLFLAAIVACGGLALGGPFAFELLLNRRIRCRDDLERGFRTVVLAEFARMDPAPAA